MELFVLNDKDYTKCITVPSYKVNKTKEEEEWVDVTKTKHKEVVRTRMVGTFSMLFETVEQLDSFIDDIENSLTTGNFIHAKFYDNKSRQLVESDYFIDFEIQNDRPFYGRKPIDPINVSIEER